MDCQTFKALASRDPGKGGLKPDTAAKFARHAAKCGECSVFLITRTKMGERGNARLAADLVKKEREDIARN